MKIKLLIIIFLLLFVFANKVDAVIRSGSYTLKLSGGSYSTFVAFWNDIDDSNNLNGALTLTMDASAFTDTGDSTEWTGGLASNTLTVTPVSFPTKTDLSDGTRFTFTSDWADFIDLRQEGPGTVIIEGISAVHEGVNGDGIYTDDTSVAYDLYIRRMVFKTFRYTLDHHENTGLLKFYNNIIIDSVSTVVFLGEGFNDGSWFANNTIVDGGYKGLIPNGTNDNISENNIIINSVDVDFSLNTYQNINHNICSDATCADDAGWSSATGNIPNYTDDPFTASSSDDFTLVLGSTPIDAGKDLSGDFTDDFFGVERDANFDIGAVEFAGGNTAPSITSILGLPDPVTAGDDISFSVDWDDEDTEGVKLFVCTTDAVTTSTPECTVATWCSDSNDYDTTDPLVCSTTTLVSQIGSGQAYYVFVCDDEVECSTSTSGNFTVHAAGSKAFKLEGVMKIEGGTVRIE